MNSLETSVLDLIGEDPENPDVFVDTDAGMEPIRDSINDAIEEIAMVTGSVKRTYRIPLRQQNFYRLDFRQGEVAWTTNVWLVGVGRRLERKDFPWLVNYNPKWMWNTGNPERYAMVGTRTMCVHPRPSSATDMLEIDAIVIPDRYTSDEERVQLRDNYQWAAVFYAVGQFYASRGNAKQARRYHDKYLERAGMQELYPMQNDRLLQFQTTKIGTPIGAPMKGAI